MPLVRIDIRKNDDPLFAKKIGEVIYRSLRTTMNVPDKDNFQILNEHDAAHFIYDPAYFGIARTDGLVYIQITLNEGRTLDQKKQLYKAVVDGLHAELAIRKEDVFISLVEVKKENWSFGNGEAQYAN